MKYLGRLRPSPAMVVASLALLVALAGTGYAAIRLPANSVGTAQLKNGAVTAVKVKRGTLLNSDFKAGQLPRGARGFTGSPGPPGPAGSPGPAGPPGPSNGFVFSKAGAVGVGSSSATIASLSLPAGNYLVSAKAVLLSAGPKGTTVTCKLVAGAATDQASTRLGDGTDVNQTQALIAPAALSAAGSATLSCSTSGGTAEASQIAVAAVQVATLTATKG